MGSLTVLIASHNPGEFLLPALDSVRLQTFKNWELLFIDDCSTDGSIELVRSIAREDPRIHLLQNERNLGLAASLNRGLERIKTPWVARMDADDLCRADRFERQMDVLAKDPKLVLLTSYLDILRGDRLEPGARGVGLDFDLLPWFLTFYNRVGGHGQVIYSLDAVRSVGGYNEANRTSEDRELWPKLIRCGRFGLVREALYVWRSHPASTTNSRKERHAVASLAADRNEIRERCGLEISAEESWLLRDFWTGHDSATADWSRAQSLLLACATQFNRKCQLPGGEGALRATLAHGWLALAFHAMRSRQPARAREHWMRAHEAAGWSVGATFLRFAWRLARLGGRAKRLI